MTRPVCPDCRGVELKPWSPSVFLYFCPCCSSRFRGGDEKQIHWGSHNDYGTYLCDR